MVDLGESLELNLKINKAIADRSVLLRDQSQVLGLQIELARELCSALECEANDFAGSLERIAYNAQLSSIEINRLTQSSNQLDTSLGNTTNSTLGLSNAQKDASKRLLLWNASFNLSKSILSKFQLTIKSVVKLMFNLGKSFFTVAKSIAALPLHVMKGLLGMARELGKVGPLQEALEEVRDKFGDLREGTAGLLKDSLRPMKKQFNEFADSGHSFAKTFGPGQGGLAKALEFSAETMGALGGAAVTLQGQLEKSMGKLAIYRKGLGMSAEEQATLLQQSMASKRPIEELQLEMGHYAVEMSKKFGDNSKVVGKAMAEMRNDIANFGTLSTKQLAQVAIYTRKLGIETKALQGIINKYDNFEDAARSASMLNQTFGMQVDVMKLMREEDPAARLNQLQKSFAATGRSYDRLSRVERKRMADLAGLDEKSAMLAFSQNGLSTSYEEVQAAGDKSENTIKDTNKVLKELSQNIKKIFQDYDGPASFFGAFVKGFQDGISYSPKFMALMRALNRSLFSVERMGRQVGRAFVETFPGAADAIVGLTKVFSPEKMGKKLRTILTAFKEFFVAIRGEPQEIRKYFFKMFDDVEGGFKTFFGSNGKNMSTMAKGIDKMLTAIGNIGIVFAEKVLMMAADFIPKLTQGIINFNKTGKFGIGLADGIFGKEFSKRFGNNLGHLGATFKDSFLPALMNMLPHLLTFMGKMMEKVRKFLEDNLPIVAEILGKILAFKMKLIIPVIIVAIKEVFKSETLLDDAILFAWIGAPLLRFGLTLIQFIPNIKGIIQLFGGLGKSTGILGQNLSGLSKIGNFIFKGFTKPLEWLGKGFSKVLGPITSSISNLTARVFPSLVGSGGRALGGLATAGKFLAGAAGPILAVGAAAISVGKQMDRVSKENVENYGMQSAKAGATIAGLLDTLTFGLMPQGLLDGISNFFAEFFGGGEQRGLIGIFKKYIATFLTTVGDTLQGIWRILQGAWDIIMGFLTFDWTRIGEGLGKMFDGIIGWFVGMLLNPITMVLKTLGEYLPDFLGAQELTNMAKNLEQRGMLVNDEINKNFEERDKAQAQRAAADPKSGVTVEAAEQATKNNSLTPEQAVAKAEAEKKIDALEEMKRLTDRIKELSNIEKEMNEVIKTIPGDEKILELRGKTTKLVESLNKVTSVMGEELRKIAPSEMSTTDMLGEKLTNNFKGLNEIIGSILSLASSGAIKTSNLQSRLTELKDGFSYISSFMLQNSSIFKTIAQNYEESSFGMMVPLAKGLTETQTSFKDFSKGSVNTKKMQGSLENLKVSLGHMKDAFTGSEGIVAILFGMKSIDPDNTGMSKISDTLASFKTMADSIPKINSKTIESRMSNLEASIKSVSSKIAVLKGLEIELENSFKAGGKSESDLPGMSSGTGYFSNFNSFTKGFDEAINSIPLGAAKKVESFVTEMKKIKNSLAQAQRDPDLDLVIDLTDFKKHSNVTFHHKNVEFNVNVNVCMDAEELTTKIVQTKTKDKKMISTFDVRR